MNAAFAAAHGIAEDPLAAALGLSDGEASDENAPDENDPRGPGPRGARRGSKKPSLPGDARAVAERGKVHQGGGKIDGDPETLAAALRLRRNERTSPTSSRRKTSPARRAPARASPGRGRPPRRPRRRPPCSPRRRRRRCRTAPGLPTPPRAVSHPGEGRRGESREPRARPRDARSAALEAETTFVDVDEDRRDRRTRMKRRSARGRSGRGGKRWGIEEGGDRRRREASRWVLLGVETLASAMARARGSRARTRGARRPRARRRGGSRRPASARSARRRPAPTAARVSLDDGVSLRGASPVTPGVATLARSLPLLGRREPRGGTAGLDFADFVPGAANPRESVALAPRRGRVRRPRAHGGPRGRRRRRHSERAPRVPSRGEGAMDAQRPAGVAETLARAGDASAIVDVLAAILDGAARAKGLGGLASRAEPPLTLDVACCVTPLAASVVRSPHATYADAAIRFARLVATSFGEVVRDACGSPGSIGVDVEGEERARKAGAIRDALRSMVDALEEIGGGGSSRRGRGNSEGSSRGCESDRKYDIPTSDKIFWGCGMFERTPSFARRTARTSLHSRPETTDRNGCPRRADDAGKRQCARH